MLRRCKCLLWPLLLALYGTRSKLNRVALSNKKKKLLRFICVWWLENNFFLVVKDTKSLACWTDLTFACVLLSIKSSFWHFYRTEFAAPPIQTRNINLLTTLSVNENKINIDGFKLTSEETKSTDHCLNLIDDSKIETFSHSSANKVINLIRKFDLQTIELLWIFHLILIEAPKNILIFIVVGAIKDSILLLKIEFHHSNSLQLIIKITWSQEMSGRWLESLRRFLMLNCLLPIKLFWKFPSKITSPIYTLSNQNISLSLIRRR